MQADTQNEATRQNFLNKAQARNVFPQQQAGSFQRFDPSEQPGQQQVSKASVAPTEFRQLIGEG